MFLQKCKQNELTLKRSKETKNVKIHTRTKILFVQQKLQCKVHNVGDGEKYKLWTRRRLVDGSQRIFLATLCPFNNISFC